MGYKFGIVRDNVFAHARRKYVGICSCGQHTWNNNRAYVTSYQCEACGNDFFVDAINQSRERFVIPYLESERRDNRGFKIKRVNLSVKYDGFSVTPVKENMKRTMEFDMVDGTLRVWRDDELEYDVKRVDNKRNLDEVSRLFFTQLPQDLFFEFVSNETTRDLYKVAKNLSGGGWKVKPFTMRGLKQLASDEYRWMQILASAGIPQVTRFQSRYRYERGKIVNIEATKPHEILQIPKFFMTYIREDVSIDHDILKNFQAHFKNLDAGKFKEIMSIVKDEGTMKELSDSIETIMQIHIDYDYINLRKLILYIFREVRLTQGIDSARDASTYLRDYIRMSRFMGLDWEKYPKSLKKEHDVVQMNYNMVNASKEKNELFTLAVTKKSYQSLLFGVKDKKEKYAIIVPETPEELVKEGNQLSHCVASYVNDVNNDKCKILFLRNKEDLEKPLATIEVRGLNIRQARGFGNRAISEEQKEFITKWAETNNLMEAYY